MSFLNDILNLLMPLSSKKITNNDEKSIFGNDSYNYNK